ncbi:serine hydrolase [Maribacter sp. 2308TA10-17]|uniref:serine hydrolase n=1 Tax=Maribacter sp. 2308TA10-17 TaxID=3386276 RepID=UPI0039BC5445
MKKLSILIPVFLLISSFGFAQISQEVQDNIKQRVDSEKHVGIVVGFLKNGEETYYSYGKTALKEGADLNENSVFEIGSISKVFTSILLSDQVLKGNMALEDPLSKYLPEGIKVPERNEKQITLKDLATHTSGLPRMPDNFRPADPNNPYIEYEKEQMYEFLSSHELTRDIGATYEYSNFGMGLLGHLLELQSGKSYEELVKERIAAVLEMTDTGITFSPAMEARLAKGHAYGSEVSNWDITGLAGAGAIRSTAADMLKFIAANINATDSPIAKAMKLSHKTAFQNEEVNFEIGLGWHFANEGTVVWHNGGTGGYRAYAGFNKNDNTGVVVLTNCVESVDDIGLHLLNPSNKLASSEPKEETPEVEVAIAILETYEGTYEFAPTFSIEITREENQLFAQATSQPKFPIYASAEDTFFLKVVEANVVFNKDAEGKVTSLTLNQNGQSPKGKKVK